MTLFSKRHYEFFATYYKIHDGKAIDVNDMAEIFSHDYGSKFDKNRFLEASKCQ